MQKMKQREWRVVGVVLLVLIVGAYMFFMGPSAFTGPGVGGIPFQPIAHGAKSSVAERVNYLITSAEDFQMLWNMIETTDAPPTVDFNHQAVIAVFAGRGAFAGISVDKIQDTGNRLVSIAVSSANTACPAAVAKDATPYEVVVVPATTLSLSHKDIVTPASCPK